MRWSPGGKSSDIDDLRGQSAGGFGGGGLRIGGGLGIGGVILLLILSAVTGTDLTSFLGDGGVDPTAPAPSAPGPSPSGNTGYVSGSPEEERLVQFVSFVLDDAQQTWDQILSNRYQHTRLVLFRDAVDSACGFAESATGPFYCPRDHRVYIDLGFYDELKRRFGAPGDFAQAYVLTHENIYVNQQNNDDLDKFANTGKPFLFTAFSCHPNAFGRVREADLFLSLHANSDVSALLYYRGAYHVPAPHPAHAVAH